MRRISFLEGEVGGGRPARNDSIAGRWRVLILPQKATGVYELRVDGTVVSGTYEVGGAKSSLRGFFVDRNLRLERIEAKGGVVITQNDQTATGDNGVFDMKTNTATLIGNVVVTQGQNVVRGDRLVIDMTTGVSRVESEKASKGQVKALLLPNSPQPGSAPGGAKETKPAAPLKIN